MAFYESISKHYDYIFPYSKSQKEFLIDKSISSKDENILEVGCGTGNLTINLAKNYKEAIGIDLDEAMITSALAKSVEVDNSYFYIMNMLQLSIRFSAESLDNVFSFGNTLVHLGGFEEVKVFFKEVYKVLQPGGNFSIQIINYDRILDKSIKSLSTIENEHIKFVRKYVTLGDKLSFDTELTIKEEEKVITNQIELFPIRKSDVQNLLDEVGFKNIQFYGGFDSSDLTDDSVPLILNCKK